MANKIFADTSLNISKIMSEKNISSDADFARKVGVTPQTVSKWKARNTYDVTKIANTFPDVSLSWLLTGEGPMLTTADESAPATFTGTTIVPAEDAETGDLRWVEVPIAPYKARAGELLGFGDPEWREGKQTIPVLLDRRVSDDYIIYEVEGNSMDDGTISGFLDGDFLLCKIEDPNEWRYLASRRGGTLCLVVTKSDGTALKQLTALDTTSGTITCHSYNSDYSDYEVQLEDVQSIFRVVELVKRRL